MLLRVNEQRNILHGIIKRKANWVGHILRINYLLKLVIEGKIKGQIETTRRQGRRRNKLLEDLKDRTGYCELKEEALDRTVWRNRFVQEALDLSFDRLLMIMMTMILYYTYSRTQLYFTQQYSRNTTTCFGPICGSYSGCDLT